MVGLFLGIRGGAGTMVGKWGYAATAAVRCWAVAVLLATGISAMADTVEVDMVKKQFIPAELTVNVGDTVRWANRERRQYHSIWFEELGEEESEYLWPGEVFERTFKRAGTFPYRCGPHPKMTGVIHVRGEEK